MEPHKIKHIVACVAIDPHDGDEGVMGYMNTHNNQWIPLIASDAVKEKSIIELAESVKQKTGIDYKLVRFLRVEE